MAKFYLLDFRDPFNTELMHTHGYSYDTSWIWRSRENGNLFVNPYVINQSDEKILFYAGASTIWRNNNINISDDMHTAQRNIIR